MLLKTYDPATEGDGEWYTPEFQGNREKPAEMRAEFYLLPLTKGEKQALEREVTVGKRSRNVVRVLEDAQAAKIRTTLQKRVTGFRNVFKPGVNGEPVPVESPKDFVAVLDRLPAQDAEDLIDELIAALTDRSVLEEGLLGNSDSRSASTPPATAAS